MKSEKRITKMEMKNENEIKSIVFIKPSTLHIYGKRIVQ